MSRLTAFLKLLLGVVASNPDSPVVQRRSFKQHEIVDEKALEFFNGLTGSLKIELSEPAKSIAGLANLAASPNAKIVSIRLLAEVWQEDLDEGRPLTESELGLVVVKGSRFRLRGESGGVIEHRAPDGSQFTVRDLLRAVEETERQTREATEWFGGVDVQHCFFEGIEQGRDGIWETSWGS